jgi:hypothetical protein
MIDPLVRRAVGFIRFIPTAFGFVRPIRERPGTYPPQPSRERHEISRMAAAIDPHGTPRIRAGADP